MSFVVLRVLRGLLQTGHKEHEENTKYTKDFDNVVFLRNSSCSSWPPSRKGQRTPGNTKNTKDFDNVVSFVVLRVLRGLLQTTGHKEHQDNTKYTKDFDNVVSFVVLRVLRGPFQGNGHKEHQGNTKNTKGF